MSKDIPLKPSCSMTTRALKLTTGKRSKSRLIGKKSRLIGTTGKFDPEFSYRRYLKKFRAEFKKKWIKKEVSPSIGLEGYTEISTLGTGFFAKVKLVRRDLTGEEYATKILNKQMLISTNQVAAIFNEKRILYSIRFPFHTSLEFSRKDNKFLYLGMTLADGGELFWYHRAIGNFNETQACFYAAQIFLALEYLHFLRLIYRDLKPENICLSANGYVKIIDYGFTKYVPYRTFTLCGTPEYIAPEIIQMKPYGSSADWWTFGVLLYEFVVGHSPFAKYATNHLKMYDKICNEKCRMPEKFSSEFKDLVSRLVEPDLSKRIGVCSKGSKDIRNHSWFKNVNWYAILNQEVQPPYIPTKNNLEVEKVSKSEKISSQRKLKNIKISDVFDNF